MAGGAELCAALMRCHRGALSVQGLSVRVPRVRRVLRLRGSVLPGSASAFGCLVRVGGCALQTSGACMCIVHSHVGWDGRLHELGIPVRSHWLEWHARCLPGLPYIESPDICSPLVPWWRAVLALLVCLAGCGWRIWPGVLGVRALSLIPFGDFDA